MVKAYDSLYYDNVEKFLHDIRISTSPYLKHYLKSNPFIFRGQACSMLGLTPSAFRSKKIDELADISGMRNRLEENYGCSDDKKIKSIRATMEYNAILNFIHFAEKIGYPLPNLDIKFRLEKFGSFFDQSNTIDEIDVELWPWIYRMAELSKNKKSLVDIPFTYEKSFDFLNIMSIAQHHGIPTRMIDWTDNPLVAAYFAAEDMDLIKSCSSEYISVWALNVHGFDYLTGSSNFEKPGIKRPFHVLRPPSYYADYIKAQKGLFVFSEQINPPLFNETSIGLEELINDHDFCNTSQTLLYKFNLKKNQVPDLLECLDLDGINASTIYPDLHGVVKHMKIRPRYIYRK